MRCWTGGGLPSRRGKNPSAIVFDCLKLFRISWEGFLRLLPALLLAASFAGAAHAAPANYPKLDTPMPAASSGPVLSAVDLFKQTAPSIYLIMAAKDDAAFRSRKGLYEGSAVAITQNLALTNCHIVKGRSKLVLI